MAPLFPHLERLLVQPGPKPRPQRCGNPRVRYSNYLSALQRIPDDANVPFKVIIAKPKRWKDSEGGKVHALKHDWLARIEGSLGCWDVEVLSS